MVILGGLGSLAGPLVGSAILSTCMELLRSESEFRMIAYAVIVLLMMWVRPQGLLGATDSILAGGKIRKKDKAAEVKKA